MVFSVETNNLRRRQGHGQAPIEDLLNTCLDWSKRRTCISSRRELTSLLRTEIRQLFSSPHRGLYGRQKSVATFFISMILARPTLDTYSGKFMETSRQMHHKQFETQSNLEWVRENRANHLGDEDLRNENLWEGQKTRYLVQGADGGKAPVHFPGLRRYAFVV